MDININNIKRAYYIIPDFLRHKVKVSLIFAFINGLLDLISLGIFIPMIIIFLNPNAIMDNSWFSKCYEITGFTSIKSFQLTLLIGTLLIFFIKNAFNGFIIHYQNKTLYAIASELSHQSIKSFFNQSYLEYTQKNSAEVSRIINTVPHDFVAYILTSYINLITETIMAVIILLAVASYSPMLFFLVIVSFVPILLVWNWFKKKHIQRIESEFKVDCAENIKQLMKGIDSYIEIAIQQKQSFFIEKYMNVKVRMNNNYAFLKSAQMMPHKILEIILITSITLIFAYTSLIEFNQSLITLLSLFIGAYYRLYPSLTKIITAKTSLESYHYILDELVLNETNEDEMQMEPIPFTRQIVFDSISFNYPDKRPLFNQVNLSIQKGKCVGLIGESGIGKSTLIKMMMGLIKPNSGKIVIDGKELNTNNKKSWLSKIGYLSQQPIIIDGSILENVAFGTSNPDLIKVQEAVTKANLTEFIGGLPNGLNTELGENGLRISGGQIQRIALARALYRETEVLIFDEISNNLDASNLSDISASINTLINLSKTVIIIDHNPAILQLAERIWNVVEGNLMAVKPISTSKKGKVQSM